MDFSQSVQGYSWPRKRQKLPWPSSCRRRLVRLLDVSAACNSSLSAPEHPTVGRSNPAEFRVGQNGSSHSTAPLCRCASKEPLAAGAVPGRSPRVRGWVQDPQEDALARRSRRRHLVLGFQSRRGSACREAKSHRCDDSSSPPWWNSAYRSSANPAPPTCFCPTCGPAS